MGYVPGEASSLPSVLAATLIILLGSILARIVGDVVGALAIQSGVTGGAVLGQATCYMILIITIILGLAISVLST